MGPDVWVATINQTESTPARQRPGPGPATQRTANGATTAARQSFVIVTVLIMHAVGGPARPCLCRESNPHLGRVPIARGNMSSPRAAPVAACPGGRWGRSPAGAVRLNHDYQLLRKKNVGWKQEKSAEYAKERRPDFFRVCPTFLTLSGVRSTRRSLGRKSEALSQAGPHRANQNRDANFFLFFFPFSFSLCMHAVAVARRHA